MKVMTGKGKRNKGNSFERRVSKMIVAAFKELGITAEDCYRTPLSGGHRYSKKEDPGDLVISPKLQKLFPFTVECKNDRRANISHFFNLKSTTPEVRWWKQACQQNKSEATSPLLVFKAHHEIFCCVLEGFIPEDRGTSALLSVEYDCMPTAVLKFATLLRFIVSVAKLTTK